MEENGLVLMQQQAVSVMPVMSIRDAIDRHKQMVGFVQEIMHKGIDYGKVPGTSKDVLFKPGAERLTTFFGLIPRFVPVKVVEQWGDDGSEPLFYYHYKCELYRSNTLVGEGDGSCSSREGKYRWRWVTRDELPDDAILSTFKRRGGTISEFTFAVDKAETDGKYGKPESYWQMFRDAIQGQKAKKIKKATAKGAQYDAWQVEAYYYRVPNDDIASVINTVLKMAQKRALVAATLITVNASEFFTQDMEDVAYDDVINGHFVESEQPQKPAKKAPEKKPPTPAQKATDEVFSEYITETRKLELLPPEQWGDIEPPTDYTQLWGGKMWILIGFAHVNHAKNALDSYEHTNAGEAWGYLLEHQRSKLPEPPVEELEF